MSTEHNPLTTNNGRKVNLTSFSGGDRGRCLQLTMGDQFVHLDRDQAAQLAEALEHWLIGDLPEEGEEENPGGNLAAV